MFDSTDRPRVFALPLGVDFGRGFVDGLEERFAALAPEERARVEIFVNTRRMQSRLRELFDAGPPCLLPRVQLLNDLAFRPLAADIPPPVSPLRRRLELTQLVSRLIETAPDLAPKSAVYDLSDSLAALMDEMHGEGVSPEAIRQLDVSDKSGHWARSLAFFNIVQSVFDDSASKPDIETRQRLVIEKTVSNWEESPPNHPIIIAGSTGSRGATAYLMEAVARLPQGAVVLPGFDEDMSADDWQLLGASDQDHPQYRAKALMARLGLQADEVTPWADVPARNRGRNRLVSLALRPAPVTDQWLSEGPKLGDLDAATKGLTILEAPSPRMEAETIALRLRAAVEEDKICALITPDRTLSREVAAVLRRWGLTPDDSAGQPAQLSPPGRLLGHVAALFTGPLTAEALLTILKHPLVNSSEGSDRGPHLRRTRELELWLRSDGPPYPTRADLMRWAVKTGETDLGRVEWADWVGSATENMHSDETLPLATFLDQHISRSEQLAAGPEHAGSGALWDEDAGRVVSGIMAELKQHADAGGELHNRDYISLFGSVLSRGEVRNSEISDPRIKIWGTLEARVQGADLVILGGLNDGVWPAAPSPDPWLNRAMRAEAGLLLPERQIGLSAHDFQQAICGKEVWLSRAVRSSDAQTVPSRWLNRLENLLGGLDMLGGPERLARMKAEGARWLQAATALATPTRLEIDDLPPAKRPCPAPPVATRPKQLSVTQIRTLIRDPYAIYARKTLRLRRLLPLSPDPSAMARGNIIHDALEDFIKQRHDPADAETADTFMAVARRYLDQGCPWPTIRRLWEVRLADAVAPFLAGEIERQQAATPEFFETEGEIKIPSPEFTLTAKADRVDLAGDGSALLYDYKTGSIPNEKQQLNFDKQLLLQAAMIERGGFSEVGKRNVAHAAFIGVGKGKKDVAAPLAKVSANETWAHFIELLEAWQNPRLGYSARMAVEKADEEHDFDHLARFGEWGMTDRPVREDLS